MTSNVTVDFGGQFVHVGLLIDTGYHSGLIGILLCTGGGSTTWEIAVHSSHVLLLSQTCSLVLANQSSLLAGFPAPAPLL